MSGIPIVEAYTSGEGDSFQHGRRPECGNVILGINMLPRTPDEAPAVDGRPGLVSE